MYKWMEIQAAHHYSQHFIRSQIASFSKQRIGHWFLIFCNFNYFVKSDFLSPER